MPLMNVLTHILNMLDMLEIYRLNVWVQSDIWGVTTVPADEGNALA